MKTTEMLSKIKSLLNANVNLAEMLLDNGTVLEAESFAAGQSVFIKTDDEKVALPIGEYKLEDGRSLVVEEEGVIASIGEAPADEVAVEAEDEVIETEVPEEVAPEVAAIVEAVVDVIAPVIEEVKEELEKLKKKLEDMEPKKEDKKDEKKKEEMSRKFKHSPERKSAKKQTVKMAENRPMTTMDRVLNKLNNR